MTESERQFELFCARRNIAFRRIPESATKTPDYEITLGTLTIVVEVKEIDPTTEDLEVIDRLRRHMVASKWVDMSKARQSILDGAKQLRAYVDNQPALVVLYERVELSGYLDSASIAQCLYGPLQTHVAIPEDPGAEPVFLGNSRGGGRVATDHHNTTLSAVGVLRAGRDDHSLSVFHNAFAARPLPPARMRLAGVRHFDWRSPDPNRLAEWHEITDETS